LSTELIWRWAFILYVLSSLQYTKRQVRRLVRALPLPAPENLDDQFISVTENDLRCYRVKNEAYDVPKEIPAHLEKYTDKPTPAMFAQWILELESKDSETLVDIKRIITASAAIHNVRIPKILRCLDNRTKALWVRLGFDLELRHVDVHQLNQEVVAKYGSLADYGVNDMARYQFLLPEVGELILTYAAENEFPCLPCFVRNLTGYRDLSKETTLNVSVIQSLATAYAVRSGFMIPASYIRCDLLTMQLVDSDQQSQTTLA
jgi:hypothetical protein